MGTTKRGIGPAYADKASRVGLRVQDLLDPKIFREKLDMVLAEKNPLLTRVYNRMPMDDRAISARYLDEFAARLTPMIADTVGILHDALDEGKKLLLEGAQATFLDLDHGTYPFVTSSNPVAGGAAVGSGLGPHDLTRISGVAKAYITRVGAGPFPTELHDETGELLRKVGNEFGATTGRPRRCGWIDLVALRFACMVNGVTKLVMTKADVLDAFEELQVCEEYIVNGRPSRQVPYQMMKAEIQPTYKAFPGWKTDISKIKAVEELPARMTEYIAHINEYLGVPVKYISNGPGRDQIILA